MVGGGPLGVGGGSVCGDWGVLAVSMNFMEVMLTSLPELAHSSTTTKWCSHRNMFFLLVWLCLFSMILLYMFCNPHRCPEKCNINKLISCDI